MEKLVDSGLVSGVIDVTTTEVCDHLFGGVLSAGADRLGAIARTRVPYVGSVGALDMVNFRAIDTVPAHYSRRNLHCHNPQVTLMRTTAEESRQIGAGSLRSSIAATGPVRFLIPEKGVSMLDAPGQPFHDPIADAALFNAIEHTLRRTRERRVERIACHINDPEFSDCARSKFSGDRWLKRRDQHFHPARSRKPWSKPIAAPLSTHRSKGSGRRFGISMHCLPGIQRLPRVKSSGGRASDAIGCVRSFLMKDGGHLREQLLALSDVDHYFTYNILISPMPVNDYVATFRLTPITVGNRTFAEWWADFNVTSGTEQAMVAQIGDDVFVRGFEALERSSPPSAGSEKGEHPFSENMDNIETQKRFATINSVASHLSNAKRSRASRGSGTST